MSQKLESGDYRFIFLSLLVCAASLLIGTRYFYKVFPEASIDFQVTRDSSRPVAEKFLATQELSTHGYRHASIFRYDDEAKVFMERELGLDRANRILGHEVRLWRWGHRWFKPMQKEELRVEVTTRGEVAAFWHVLPEDAAAADLNPEAARSLAESFLVLEMKRPIDSLEFLDSQTQKRPHRTDHIFTWKVLGLEYNGATYRVSVTVQGDRVDGYSEFLKIPEGWTRNYARLRSLNESTTIADMLLFLLLGVAMLATLGQRLPMKDVRWKTALAFAVVSFILQFLALLNQFPLTEYDFDTTSSFGSFVGRTVLLSSFTSLGLGGLILILTASSEPLYRQAYPSHLSISHMFTWHGIRTRSFFLASLAGITLTFFFFAFEIGFYLVAQKLGAWAPAEIPYTDLVNTRFPWVFVLLGGFFPAVSEEWMFRCFAIPYLGSLFRKRWIAIVIASLIWGFGHANYPNQPFFIRGIEVGIVGVVLSWAMLRFGILAPLIAHYSIDAFYSAFLLLRSGNPYLVTTGAVTAGINLIPLLIAAGAYLATRSFRSEAPVSNAAEGAAPPLPEQPARPEPPRLAGYRPLSRQWRYAAFALFALGAVLVLFAPPRLGDSLQFRISATEARNLSTEFLSGLGFNLEGYRRVTQPQNRLDAMAAQYIYNAGGFARLNQFYSELTPALAWQTRFYKPSQKEEFRVNVDPSAGKPVSFRHLLDEDAPGPELPQDRARQIAVSFLEARGYELRQYELKETRSEKPKQRRDTEFTWEARDGTDGAVNEARLRLQAAVLGDRIGLWTHFVNIPEEWRRNREEQTFYRIAVTTARAVFFIVLGMIATVTLLRGTRHGSVQWKLAAKVGLVVMLLDLMDAVNSVPELLFQYDTSSEMEIFLLTGIVLAAIRVIGLGLAAALAAGSIMACFPEVPLFLKKERRLLWSRDVAVACVAAVGAYLVLQGVVAQIEFRAGRFGLAPALSIPANLGKYVPLASSLRDALLSSLFYSAVLALGVHIWTRLQSRKWLRLALLAGLIISLLPPGARRVSEIALDIMPSLLLIVLASWLVKRFLRNNYLAYVSSTAVLGAVRVGASLLGQGNLVLQIQGIVLWALVLATLSFLWLRPRELTIDD